MRVLVIGGGGREHTLCWKISQSPRVNEIFCIPGNGGIEKVAICRELPYEKDFSSLISFVRREKIDFTVVGPEAPLVGGIVDQFEKEGLKIFGPSRKAARLEGSKVYAKQFMKKYGIPTAEFETFSDLKKAIDYIDEQKEPLVVKADGLAGGKGSIVTRSKEEAIEAARQLMEDKIFGSAGERIVVEKRLKGEELSFFVITDGVSFKVLVSSRDYKPAYDGDKGPNTGGMGSYSPAPLRPSLFKKIINRVVIPTLEGMKKEGTPYKGVLYLGLMIHSGEPKVLEYNCRFGDPETQVILPRLFNDIMELFQAVDKQRLDAVDLKWRSHATTCVVLTSKGYPGSYEKGKPIEGLDNLTRMRNVFAFCAGVKRENGRFLTNGGRVVGVTGMGKNLKESIKTAYRAVKKISFEGMHYRRDIGYKGLVS
ncbi:MAG TPA: phosphoribosylamine--glycine ligase [Candidatus Aerophobetes bacterium]|uniref:Phosphoribosylamine--glycine ligase n=1 Tax=Aerophobetes bacterium TaxID=2030807 RepID=A0A7V0N0X4_UNCAE|nr:phosphoribosylamine--glycine ligase [Candidatus Aerophobetes bacterium]